MTETKTVDAVFGQRIGRSAASVSRLRRGLQQPTLATLSRIRDETGGAVDAIDFPVEEYQPQVSLHAREFAAAG